MVCSQKKGDYNKLICRKVEASTPEEASFFTDMRYSRNEDVMMALPVDKVDDKWFSYHHYWVLQEEENVNIRFHFLQDALAYIWMTEGLADSVLENSCLADSTTTGFVRKSAKAPGFFDVWVGANLAKMDIENKYDAMLIAYQLKAKNVNRTIRVFKRDRNGEVPSYPVLCI